MMSPFLSNILKVLSTQSDKISVLRHDMMRKNMNEVNEHGI